MIAPSVPSSVASATACRLQFEEFGILAAEREQLLVRSLFTDRPPAETRMRSAIRTVENLWEMSTAMRSRVRSAKR